MFVEFSLKQDHYAKIENLKLDKIFRLIFREKSITALVIFYDV
jgi:hypothetical protein